MRNDVLAALRRALSPVSLLRPEAVLLAAVSGGADSVALAWGLSLLRREAGFALHIVHVEHGLRGDESLEDAAFVRELCQRLDAPLLLYRASLAGDMDSPGAEARAREARRQCFAKAMEACGAHALLTAHHLEDQAETVLMRLMRGAGAKGLSGMRASSPFGPGLLLRPFLSLSRESLIQFLGEEGQSWREDQSNQTPCCLRNRLRLTVLPRLNALQPRAAAHLAQTARRLQWDEDCLSDLAEGLLAACRFPWPACHALRRQPLLDAPMALALRALRGWASTSPFPSGEQALSHGDTLALYQLAIQTERGARNLPGGLRAVRTEGYLHLERQNGRPLAPLDVPAPLPLPCRPFRQAFGTLAFALSPMTPGEPPPDGKRSVLLTDALLRRGLCLRLPRPEDRIRPFGAPGGKPLRRYFTDRKADAAFRPGWPVLALGGDILWVAGMGAAEATRTPEASGESLWRLAVEGPVPITCEVHTSKDKGEFP